MPTRNVSVRDPEREAIERRRMWSERLLAQSQQGAPQEWNAMRIVPSYGVGQGLTQLGQALLGSKINRDVSQQETTLDEQERQAMAARLQGLVPRQPIQPGQPGSGVLRPGQPSPFTSQQQAAMQSIGALPLEQQGQILGQVSTERLFPTETGKQDRLVSPANPSDFEPASLAEYQRTGDPSKLVPRNQTYGRYNPRDYSAESWASFVETNDPAVLVRVAPSQARTTAGGGLLAFDPLNPTKPTTVISDEAATAAAAAKASAETTAKESVIPATDRLTAQNKFPRVQAAQRRLQRVLEASTALENNILAGGPMQAGAIGLTEEGNELDQANAQLLTELTALTRTPGLGSQSDFEQRLAQLVLPNAGMYPSVRRKAIAELQAFMEDLGYAVQQIGSGEVVGAGPQVGAVEDGYRFKGGDPSKPESWEKVQ